MAERPSALNTSPKRLDGPGLLHQLVHQASKEIAIEDHDVDGNCESISYEELHCRSDRLANSIRTRLKRSTTGRSIVPLLLPQHASLYIAQLAILKAGAAFCPLPLDAPEDRIRFILKDVEASTVITNASLRSRIPSVEGIEVIDCEADQGNLEIATVAEVSLKDLAYVMYTSGSTGLPKGVLLSHDAVTQALLAHDRHIPSYTRFMQVAAPTFDVSVFEIFFTFFRGQTLICCDRTQLLSDLPGAINSFKVDAIELTPSVASNLLGSRKGVPGLKVLLTIGEMLKKSVVEEFGATSTTPALLHGMYGPTEAAIHCTLQPHFTADMVVNNIGIPLDTVSAFVLPPVTEGSSQSLDPLPYGEEGELVVGGHQLADGYLNRDEQTRAAFIEHGKYGRLYRTGDKARFVEHGKIECLGRISGGQVKLRGQRLELGEVEHAVAKTPGCRGAVAEVINDSLVAFCEPSSVSEQAVRETCKKWLPAYMIPADIIFQDELPYLASGKIDRRRLRTQFEDATRSTEEFILPEGSVLTERIVEAVRSILGPNAIRGEDLRLTSIDSLSSIRLATALGKIANIQPMATHVMEASTVEDLANLLLDGSTSEAQAAQALSDDLIRQRLEQTLLHPALSAARGKIEEVLPCSAVQAAMLTETELHPGRYCNWLEFEVDQKHELHDVEAALNTLLGQHALLRAGFVHVGGAKGGYTTVIWKPDAQSQIMIVPEFDRFFSAEDEGSLLHACHIQLRSSHEETRILFQLHHAIYDQWSVDVLLRDLTALLNRRTVEAPSFGEVVKYYMSQIGKAVDETSMAFWRDQVDAVDSLTFPSLTSIRQAPRQDRTSWQPTSIKPGELQEHATRLGCSSQAIAQASYAVLLSSLHGAKDICYGTVFSGRHLPISGIDSIFGPCLTTLPVRLRLQESTSWHDVISAVHDTNRRMLRHSSVPLDQIKKFSGLAVDEALFDTLFIWQDSTVEAAGPLSVVEIDSADYHEFKLVVECRAQGGSMDMRITYDASLVPAEQVQGFIKQLDVFIQLSLAHPDSKIASLETYLPHHLMSICNAAPVSEAEGQDLVEVLERSAELYRDRHAIIFAASLGDTPITQSITFKTLHGQANQLARHLMQLGVKADDAICICMEKSVDFYIAILAAVKSGAGYLPLVPETKTDRVADILSQAPVKVVLTDSAGAHHFAHCPHPVLEPATWRLSEFSNDMPGCRTSNSALAYMVFTSGSTGTPKGVVVTRGNLLGNILTLQRLYKAAAGDRLLQACLQSFDVAVFEIFFSFYTGLAICTSTRDVLFDDLEHAIRTMQVTHLSMTPSVASLVHPDNVPTVKFLVTAGEAMTAAVHSAWAGRSLHQGYGPSETTNICTVNMNMSTEQQLGWLGPPFRNTSAFVIDVSDERRILPQGAFGEFVFGGEQVFRGYQGLDDLNNEKLWTHPQFGRLYRSGDLGRILADGSLLIHGRSDFQVKIRGNRIELGEISSLILRQAFVTDCVTLVGQSDSSEPVLWSFWTSDGGSSTVSVKEWDKSLQEQQTIVYSALESYLPAYMLPSLLIPVSRLPRTEQGKLDSRSLRGLVHELSRERREVFARSAREDDGLEVLAIEGAIAEALEEALQLPATDLNRLTAFESYGLTSINAVRFSKTLQEKVNKRVAVSTILRHPSIARLAHAIENIGSNQAKTVQSLDVFDKAYITDIEAKLSATGRSVSHILPCTPLQEAMLVASLGISSAYSNSTTYTIKGDVNRLKECFEQSAIRHTILRTVFVQTESAERPFAQVILTDAALVWQKATSGPTSQVTLDQPILFEVSDRQDEVLLTIHMHHATYDGMSLAILLEEVEALYHEQELQAAPLPHDFLRLCLEQAGSEARTYWSAQLRDMIAAPFPAKSETKAQSTEQITDHDLDVSMTAIETLCKKASVSINVAFQAAWAVCLAHLQQSTDVCFGIVVSGRNVPVSDIDQLVLPCFNTIPVRVPLSRVKTTSQLVKLLNRLSSRSTPYQLAPLRMIQRCSQDPAQRLFDSLLLVQAPDRPLDEQIWVQKSETGEMGFPIVLELIPNDAHITLRLHSQADCASLAPSIATCFAHVVQSIVMKPDELLQDIVPQHNDTLAGALKPEQTSSTSPQVTTSDACEEWSAEEETVAGVLAYLAKIDRSKVRKNTSLFELGLDSLNAAQVASMLRKRGHRLDLADVMEHRTPQAIATVLGIQSTGEQLNKGAIYLEQFDRDHRAQALDHHARTDEEIEAVLPCSQVQQGMLAQSSMSKGALYVNHIRFALPETHSDSSIHQAIAVLRRRHPLLRALFSNIDSQDSSYIMVVLRPKADLKQDIVIFADNLPHLPKVAAEMVDDDRKPLWRATVVSGSGQRQLLLSIHHALYDATGLQTLSEDLASALNGQQSRAGYDLSQILTSNLVIDDSYAKHSEDFWHNTFEAAAYIPFPSMTSRQVKQGTLNVCQISSSISQSELEELCRDRQTTIQAAGQAAWAYLLSSYLGEDAVTFGTVLSTRDTETQSQLFPALNTLPVSTTNGQRTQELLQEMMSYNTNVQRYRLTSLSDIQRFAGRPCEALFDTVFVFQKAQDHDLPKLEITEQSAAVDYKLSMELEFGSDDSVSLTLSYATNCIDEDHARLLIAQYDAVLLAILRQEQLNDAIDKQLLSITPPLHDALPAPVSYLHEVLSHSTKLTPDAVALEFISSFDVDASKKWTYRELDELSTRLAGRLQHFGAKLGGVVAVCMEKCPEASFCFPAILKTGCAFLAMDPALPKARKEFIMSDSKAVILLVDKTVNTAELDLDAEVLVITMTSIEKASEVAFTPQQIDSSSTCYCLYTSGTTGTPKGCEITHENAVQAMMSFQRLFSGHWKASSRWLQFASYWFDVSILEHFWSWSVGITMVGAPRDLVLSDLVLFINEANITHIDLTPSLARLLEPEEVPSLCNGVFITGGEALKQEIIQKWGQHKVICNGYGPTEATIGVTMNPFIHEDARPANIGPPFANVGSYVLNLETDLPVLRGAIGELCVSGKLVGKGYLNREDLTAKSFPTLEHLGERIYRTGDLVRQLADNSFLFIGRKDSQAKLRGQRLELDEIDEIVKASETSFRDVASLVIKSEDGNKQTLVTFAASTSRMVDALEIDSSTAAQGSLAKALEACRTHLPGYMVPTSIVPLAAIPLTVNNKIDIKGLTKFYNEISPSQLRELGGQDEEALSADGKEIANVLAAMLKLDSSEIGGNSNLFALGLSSVSAVRFVQRLQKAGYTNVDIGTVMRTPVLNQLAKQLASKNGEDSANDSDVQQARLTMSAIDRKYRRYTADILDVGLDDIEAIAPCTALQSGLLLESLRSDQYPYFNRFSFKTDDLDLDKLTDAIAQIVSTEQILRTKFVETDDGYLQTVLKNIDVPSHRSTCSHSDLEAHLAKAQRIWIESNSDGVHHPFALLLTTCAQSTVTTLFLHHAIYDGVSLDLMLKALSATYANQHHKPGPKFIDALAHGPLQSRSDASQFWSEALGDLAFSPLVTRDHELSKDKQESNTIRCSIDFGELDKQRKAFGVSHQAIVQSAFIAALREQYPHCGSMGVIVSGRTIPVDDIDRLLGPMFNTVPQDIAINDDETWESLVRRCHNYNISMLPYQFSSLREIRRWCKMQPSDELFDTLFVFQIEQDESDRTSILGAQIEDPPRAEYPLALEATLKASGVLDVLLVVQSHLIDEDALRGISERLSRACNLIEQQHEDLVSDALPSATVEHAPKSKSSNTFEHLNGVHDFKWTPLASKIRAEVASIAGVPKEQVDEHTSLFGLGLDSIDAVRLSSRLKKANVALSVSELLKAQTIPRMAARGTTKQDISNADPLSALKKSEAELQAHLEVPSGLDRTTIDRILPATPSQEALLTLMHDSDFANYFNHDLLAIEQTTDPDRLNRAWQTVVRDHAILRTSFLQISDPNSSSTFAQVIHKPADMSTTHAKLRNMAELDILVEKIREEVAYTIETIPPLRITFVALDGRFFLLLSIAHALYDGHSLSLLHQDVAAAYHNRSLTRPSPDQVINDALQAASPQAQNFWQDTLHGAEPCRLAKRIDEPAAESQRDELTLKMSAEAARELCRQHGVSLQTLGQTCWSLVLARHARVLEVLFGVVMACRDSEEAEQVMFPTMNTVIVRAALHGTGKDMLRTTQDFANDMLPYKQTPLRAIQSALAKATGSGAGQLFDTLFIFQQRPREASDTPTLYHSQEGSAAIDYPVAIEMQVVGNDLVLSSATSRGALQGLDPRDLLRDFDTIMQSLITNADQQCVRFEGKTVSILGLPPLDPVDSTDLPKEHSLRNKGAEKSLDTNSKPYLDIVDVLAKVSSTRVEDIKPDITLESLGIDSVTAIKVTTLLRKRQIKTTVSSLIKAKAISAIKLTQSPSQASGSTDQHDVVHKTLLEKQLPLVDKRALEHAGISTDNVKTMLPATAGQVYMLASWRMSAGRLFYPTFKYRVTGGVSQAALQAAWQGLVAKHDILRTVFLTGAQKGTPTIQVVLQSHAAQLAIGGGWPDRALQPMANLGVEETSDGSLLSLRIHHALYDAISLPLLMQDLGQLLSNQEVGNTSSTFAEYINLTKTEQAQASRQRFWEEYLTKPSSLHIVKGSSNVPTKRVEAYKPGFISGIGKLEKVARERGLNVQSILFAVWAKVYTKFACRRRCTNVPPASATIGVYLSNRGHLDDMLDLRAPTVNLVPLLARKPTQQSVLELAAEMQADLKNIGEVQNSSVALWELAEWKNVKLETFVNFLRLPESDEDRGSSSTIAFEHVDQGQEEEREEVVDIRGDAAFAMPKGLEDLPEWSGVYKDSLDVELRIAGDKLDVGIFVVENLAKLENVKDMLTHLKTELEALMV